MLFHTIWSHHLPTPESKRIHGGCADPKLLNRQMFTPSVRLEGPQLGWGARRAQTARYLKGPA